MKLQRYCGYGFGKPDVTTTLISGGNDVALCWSLAQLEGLPFPVDISFVKIRLIFSQIDNSSVKCLLPHRSNLVYPHPTRFR